MYERIIKRGIDLVFAVPALLVAAPVFLLLFVLLKLTGHRKLIFIQRRVGYKEKIFSLYKICTMTDARDEEGQLLPDADRLTKLGRFIRKTSLDELPQLINVLKGDMSIVGPRPLLIEYLPLYSSEQRKRHLVRPGITGWAQVNGRNAISWKTKFELDVWYVSHCSLLLDMRIFFLTIRKLFATREINEQGQATMTKFTGNE